MPATGRELEHTSFSGESNAFTPRSEAGANEKPAASCDLSQHSSTSSPPTPAPLDRRGTSVAPGAGGGRTDSLPVLHNAPSLPVTTPNPAAADNPVELQPGQVVVRIEKSPEDLAAENPACRVRLCSWRACTCLVAVGLIVLVLVLALASKSGKTTLGSIDCNGGGFQTDTVWVCSTPDEEEYYSFVSTPSLYTACEVTPQGAVSGDAKAWSLACEVNCTLATTAPQTPSNSSERALDIPPSLQQACAAAASARPPAGSVMDYLAFNLTTTLPRAADERILASNATYADMTGLTGEGDKLFGLFDFARRRTVSCSAEQRRRECDT